MIVTNQSSPKKQWRKCHTPWCQSEVVGREDKKYCSPRCKASHHNHETRRLNQTVYSYEGVIRQNEKLLKRLYQNKLFKEKGLSRDVLDGEGVNLSICCSIEEHTTTKGTIFWYGCYGVEAAKENPKHFWMHQRAEEKVPQYLKRRRYV